MIRVFLAVELGEGLRSQVARLQQDLTQRLGRHLSAHARLSWVQPSSIHLTIKFLGDIEELLVMPLRECVDEVTRHEQVIVLPLERLGVFPRREQPRVLWAGPTAQWEQGVEGQRLMELQQAIERCCEGFDLAPERKPWSPHLTLARIKTGERDIGRALEASGMMDRSVSLGSMKVETVVLMKSELRPTGSVYTPLWHCSLVGQE